MAERDREEACDELAARAAKSPREYGQTLLKLYASVSRRRNPLPEPILSMDSNLKHTMKKRIESLATTPPSPFRRRLLTGAGFVTLCFFVVWLGAEREMAYAVDNPESKPVKAGTKTEGAALEDRLKAAVIGDLDFKNMPVDAAIDFSLKHVKGEPVKVKSYPPEDALITLRLKDIPVSETLKYLATLAKSTLVVEPDGIRFEPAQKVEQAAKQPENSDQPVVLIRAVLREVSGDGNKANTLTIPKS